MTPPFQPDDPSDGPDFCTLGMLILDDIYYSASSKRPPSRSILGGAGSYAVVGARLLSPGHKSSRIAWTVDAGTDFPTSVREEIEGWNVATLFREATNGRLTTRGWNGYEGGSEERAFRYLTPKLRIEAADLPDWQIRSRGFHLICSAARCVEQMKQLKERKQLLNIEDERTITVWEPVPDFCNPEQLDAIIEAMKHVSVISPNHTELGALVGQDVLQRNGQVNEQAVQGAVRTLLESDKGGKQPVVVVRCGVRGCYLFLPGPDEESGHVWLPAYHTDTAAVIDPTGGGNAFLGGFTVALARCDRLDYAAVEEAVVWGSIAASFAIEQVGLPKLQAGTTELWNETDVLGRFGEFKARWHSMR